MNEKVTVFGYFTSSVPIEHSHPFTAEMCVILAITITVDHNLMKHPNYSTSIKMTAGLDC